MKHLHILFILVLIFPVLAGSQTPEVIDELEAIDEIAPFSEGLAAVRRGNQWGFINNDGNLVIAFRDDLVWDKDADVTKSDILGVRYPLFKDGRCLVKKIEDEIPTYGFIDTNGGLVIDHQFLNVSPFDGGYTTGVVFDRVFRGNNEFNLRIYDYKYHDVLMDAAGKIVEFFDRRYNIQLTIRRYELPELGVKLLSKNLIALQTEDKRWKIRKLNL